ncbi:MAG TPA: hypothetical protein VJA18_03120 [Candidatus Nanoarchaeia archaeon]|nr:hypothetical protein [Candidatus Nanoarchaeia archaeon]
MQDQDKILFFLRTIGPTIPSKVAKHINTEILLASAHLSDLVAQGKVKVSHLKIGGSPLYYLAGQEEKLYHFAAGNLNPKDFQVLEKLKEKRILRESSLDLLSKVALRSLHDFAVPLHVTIAGNKELFWKWHLLSDQEMNDSIRAILYPPAQEQKLPAESTLEPGLEQQQATSNLAAEIKKLEAQQTLIPEKTEQQKNIEQKPASAEEVVTPRVKARSQRKKVSADDQFIPLLEEYFNGRSIQIQEQETLRRNTEINLLIRVPSVVGKLTYFCKAKKKAKCDEGDLSAAYMEAQIKKLPLLFLYTHELNKKAQEMLATDAFQNAIVKKLEKEN